MQGKIPWKLMYSNDVMFGNWVEVSKMIETEIETGGLRIISLEET